MARAARSRRSPEWCLAAAAAGLLLAAPDARADEPVQADKDSNPSAVPPPSTHVNLLLLGAGLTVGWYGAAYGASYLWPDSDGASSLRVPIAGPYMALAKTGCSDREKAVSSCGTFTLVLRTILTGLTAVGQTGGVLAMVEGIFVSTGSRGERPPPPSTSGVHVLPMVGVATPSFTPPIAGAPDGSWGKSLAGLSRSDAASAAAATSGLGFEIFGDF